MINSERNLSGSIHPSGATTPFSLISPKLNINAAIEEALNQNPSFRLAIIDPGFDNDTISNSLSKIKKVALESERILLVAETFTDFANYFPELKTYDSDNYEQINLKNDRPKD